MAALSVRVSEDPARPLGHAIVTLGGLPRGLETFEFTLSRHGFGANYLGPDGWQGAECWLQPEEAWFSGEVLKFVMHPDLVFQLENMPYQLTVRGQGLAGTATVTFSWPMQLELEEGSAGSERQIVGGARVNAAPAPRAEPVNAVPPVAAPPLPDSNRVEPPPLAGKHSADIAIPEVLIPQLGTSEVATEEDQEDRTRPFAPAAKETAPRTASEPVPAPTVTQAVPPPLPASNLPLDEDATQRGPGRLVPPALNSQRNVSPDSAAGVPPPLAAPQPTEQSPAPTPAPTPTQAEPRVEAPIERGRSGLVAGLLAVVVLVGGIGGWWWWSHRTGDPSPAAGAKPAAPMGTTTTPEPVPAAPAPAKTPLPPVVETRPVAPVEPVRPEPSVPVRPVEPEPPRVVPPTVPRAPVQPEPQRVPLPPTVPPAPPAAPVERERPAAPAPATPRRPPSGQSLEDELKSQFDPTLQELEKRLRPPKSP